MSSIFQGDRQIFELKSVYVFNFVENRFSIQWCSSFLLLQTMKLNDCFFSRFILFKYWFYDFFFSYTNPRVPVWDSASWVSVARTKENWEFFSKRFNPTVSQAGESLWKTIIRPLIVTFNLPFSIYSLVRATIFVFPEGK